jgi:hypothetical protein
MAFAVTVLSLGWTVHAQDRPRIFAGGVAGLSTLSADATAVITSAGASTSMYKPENGIAVNLFAGVHLAQYFSVQGNWMWNRNDLALISASTLQNAFYQQPRRSDQHAFVADALIYFRRLDDTVRPYLGTGLSIIRFSSRETGEAIAQGVDPPPGDINATEIGLRSHVGIDIRLSRRIDFRYSFSETIGGNPVSPQLTPPGTRRLANFQNLFGLVGRF